MEWRGRLFMCLTFIMNCGKRGYTLNFHYKTQPFITKIRSASGGFVPWPGALLLDPTHKTPIIGSRLCSPYGPLFKLLDPPVGATIIILYLVTYTNWYFFGAIIISDRQSTNQDENIKCWYEIVFPFNVKYIYLTILTTLHVLWWEVSLVGLLLFLEPSIWVEDFGLAFIRRCWYFHLPRYSKDNICRSPLSLGLSSNYFTDV